MPGLVDNSPLPAQIYQAEADRTRFGNRGYPTQEDTGSWDPQADANSEDGFPLPAAELAPVPPAIIDRS